MIDSSTGNSFRRSFGASGIFNVSCCGLFNDISEMLVIDNAPLAADQNSSEYGTTICMKDQTGPYDYHLNQKLAEICARNDIEFSRNVFKYYRSDSASVIEAGNDTQTALIGFGVDGSYGYERVQIDSLVATAHLLSLYIQSPPTFLRDKTKIATLDGFPHQLSRGEIEIKT